MGDEGQITHAELNAALLPFVTREELKQFIEGLAPKMQLAVMNGVKEAMPQILEKIEDKYGQKVSSMHRTLYDPTDGMVLMMDRVKVIVQEIPGLVRMKWQLFGFIAASNVLALFIGWWAATNFATPKIEQPYSQPVPTQHIPR